jgi:molybdopterin-biosynthesis enzyme MoeA-like protein
MDNQLMPLLKQHDDEIYYEEIIDLPLRDESNLAPIIDEVMKRIPDVWVKSMVKPYGESGIRLWISARGSDREKLVSKIKNAIEVLKELVGSQLLKK